MKTAHSFSHMTVGEVKPQDPKKLAARPTPSKDPLASEWSFYYGFTLTPGEYYVEDDDLRSVRDEYIRKGFTEARRSTIAARSKTLT